MSFRHDGGTITITMPEDDHTALLVCIGFAIGCMLQNGESDLARGAIQLVNQMNEGNPRFTPYETEVTDGSRG